MTKEKFIQTELNRWKEERLITEEQYSELSGRYPVKDGLSLMVVFSILGALFVGGGIILLLARNWSNLPLLAQSILSFLPLAVSQGICVFVFFKRYGSAAWREGAALFNVLCVYASMALAGRVFHLPSDMDMYFTVCAFLGLPAIYLFKASSPVLIYLASIIAAYWGNYNPGLLFGVLLWAPVLPVIFYNIIKRRDTPGGTYTGWVSGVSWIVFTIILMDILDTYDFGIVLMLLSCFTLLYGLDLWFYPGGGNYGKRPYLVLSMIGMVSLLEIFSLATGIRVDDEYLFYIVIAAETVMFGLAIIKRKIRGILRISGAVVILLFTVLFFLTVKFDTESLIHWGSIALLIYLSVVFIVKGINRLSYPLSNLGMFIIVLTAVIQFFSGDHSFLVKGLSFIITGAGFFAVNFVVRKQKRIHHESR